MANVLSSVLIKEVSLKYDFRDQGQGKGLVKWSLRILVDKDFSLG